MHVFGQKSNLAALAQLSSVFGTGMDLKTISWMIHERRVPILIVGYTDRAIDGESDFALKKA